MKKQRGYTPFITVGKLATVFLEIIYIYKTYLYRSLHTKGVKLYADQKYVVMHDVLIT